MKKFKYIALAAALLLVGCNKWLDVKPRGQSSEKEMFSTERGFESALIGVYTQMAENNLYGFNASMAVPEFIAQTWVDEYAGGDKADWRSHLVTFRYNDLARGRINGMFSQYYKCIAQLNVIIRNFERSDAEFVDDHKAMLWGEALGLRAFLHFELLRFFGPVPATATAGTPTLPYMTFTTVDPSKMTHLTYENFLKAVNDDLVAAANKLKDIDPVLFYNQSEMSPAAAENLERGYATNSSELNRRRRFNYWAVVATRARVSSWMGDKVGAAKLAIEVISAENPHNNGGKPGRTFNLTRLSDYQGGFINYTMNSEHIFGLSKPSMQSQLGDVIKGIYSGANPRKPELSQFIDPLKNALCLNPGSNPNDIRNLDRYWRQYDLGQSGNTLMYYQKYVDIPKGGANGADLKSTNRVPMIRLAEMLFLAIEGLPASDAYAHTLLQEFCISRNMDERLWETITEDNKMKLLTLEYRKDFIAEGQMFFLYKRLNAKELEWPTQLNIPEGAWVLPRPEMQQLYDPYPDMGITPEE